MGTRILVISLVPKDLLGRTIGELRRRLPGVRIAALAASAPVAGGPDEVILWPALGPRQLTRSIRARRFDLLLLAHGRDQYLSRAFWKAMLLALVSRSRGIVLCREGRFGAEGAVAGRSRARAVIAALAGAAGQLALEGYVIAMGAMLLPVLAGIAVTDIAERFARPAGREGRSAHRRR